MGIRCADHVTPLYPQKLALISPTGGGRSVGIVPSRTKATEFSFKNVRRKFHRQLVVVYGDGGMEEENVREWCRLFKIGRSNVHDEERSGRPIFGHG